MKNLYISVILILVLSQFFIFPLDINQKNLEKLNFQKEEFCFVVVSDSHNNFLVFNEVMKEAEKTNPSFIIINGDFTHEGTFKEYLLNQIILQKSDIPILVNIGNHDIRNNGFLAFSAFYGLNYYSFNYSNTKIILLDNSEKISEKQISWFEDELRNDFDKTILIVHKPIYEHNEEIMSLISEEKVDVVIQSHKHRYVEKEFDGVKYYVSTSSGGYLKPNSQYGFMKVCVDEEIIVENVPVFVKQSKISELFSEVLIRIDLIERAISLQTFLEQVKLVYDIRRDFYSRL